MNIAKTNDGQYVFTQPSLIDAIINDIGIQTEQRKSVPMSAHKLLHHHLDSSPHNPHHFNYRSVGRKLNYLAQISQPDICYAVHQCAKYSSNPHTEHKEAIIYLAKYPNSTHGLDFWLLPSKSKSIECFADANFCGNWVKDFTDVDPATAKSQSRWCVTYAGCPIW